VELPFRAQKDEGRAQKKGWRKKGVEPMRLEKKGSDSIWGGGGNWSSVVEKSCCYINRLRGLRVEKELRTGMAKSEKFCR